MRTPAEENNGLVRFFGPKHLIQSDKLTFEVYFQASPITVELTVREHLLAIYTERFVVLQVSFNISPTQTSSTHHEKLGLVSRHERLHPDMSLSHSFDN